MRLIRRRIEVLLALGGVKVLAESARGTRSSNDRVLIHVVGEEASTGPEAQVVVS